MKDLKKHTLLIVDDEEDLRAALVFDFKRRGFTVLSAENGAKAAETLAAHKVSLVLSDVKMSGGDGMSLLKHIREIDAAQRPIVILVTGFAEHTKEECLACGAQDVIPKPFDRKILIQSVLSALDGSNRKDDL